MTRSFITRKKFYDIRHDHKVGVSNKAICWFHNISPTTLTRVLQARNFKEYKASGSIYGKGVKVLRKRYLFILGVLVVVLLILNLR